MFIYKYYYILTNTSFILKSESSTRSSLFLSVRFKWHRNATMRFFNIHYHQQEFMRAESA